MEQSHSNNILSEEERRRRKEELRRQAQERLANAGRYAAGASSQQNDSPFVAMAEPLDPVTPPTPSSELSTSVLPPETSNKTPSAVAVLSLVLAGGAILAAGYLYTQLEKTQTQLTAVNTLLTQKAAQLDGLSQKLSATGETADLSLDALKVVLRDQEAAIGEMGSRISENTNRIRSFPNMDSLAQDQRDFVKLAYDLKVKVGLLEEQMQEVAPVARSSGPGVTQLRSEVSDLRKAVSDVSQTYSYKEVQDMKLQLEDINIRLDRIQNAVSAN